MKVTNEAENTMGTNGWGAIFLSMGSIEGPFIPAPCYLGFNAITKTIFTQVKLPKYLPVFDENGKCIRDADGKEITEDTVYTQALWGINPWSITPYGVACIAEEVIKTLPEDTNIETLYKVVEEKLVDYKTATVAKGDAE